VVGVPGEVPSWFADGLVDVVASTVVANTPLSGLRVLRGLQPLQPVLGLCGGHGGSDRSFLYVVL
jgi:hypothetical protein